MRKYQRKLVGELRETYQSKDVLRWLYLNQRMGGDRIPTKREMRIVFRRMVKTARKMVGVATDVFRGIARVMAGVGKSMRQIAENMGLDMNNLPEKLPTTIPTMNIDIDGAVEKTTVDKINEIRGVGDGTAE